MTKRPGARNGSAAAGKEVPDGPERGRHVTGTVAEAAAERLAGGRPSRTRALTAAAVAAVAAGTIVYRLLRSRGETR
jgi:hypothetical protein